MKTASALSFAAVVSSLLRNPDFNLKIANALDRAYNEGTGNPSGHKPFDDAGSVQNNLPGFYGTVSAATIIAAQRSDLTDGGQVYADTFEGVLRDMAAGNLDETEVLVARASVNSTWRQRNADRDLARAARAINAIIFVEGAAEIENLEAEVAKDDYQWKTAAAVIVEEVDALGE